MKEYHSNPLIVQAFTHKSFVDKLAITKPEVISSLHHIDPLSYNLELLEWVGDSLLNFTICQHFYKETAFGDNGMSIYFTSYKLHEIKTLFTGNSWLGFMLYQMFYLSSNRLGQTQKYGELVRIPVLYEDSND